MKKLIALLSVVMISFAVMNSLFAAGFLGADGAGEVSFREKSPLK